MINNPWHANPHESSNLVKATSTGSVFVWHGYEGWNPCTCYLPCTSRTRCTHQCHNMWLCSTWKACSTQYYITILQKLAEWRSGSVSALPWERPGFASRTRLREIIPAINCTMQGQNNCGNWGSPGEMKLWVAWEVLRWLMKFRELCSGGFHPKLVTPPYHGFLSVNTPPNSQNSKRHQVQHNTQVPVGKHNNRQHASLHHEVATDVKQMPIRPIIISLCYVTRMMVCNCA